MQSVDEAFSVCEYACVVSAFAYLIRLLMEETIVIMNV
jgi:hypothetical protein